MIEVYIDGRAVSVERGSTVLEAAGKLGIHIPTLCHHEGLSPDGNCRLCSVEIDDRGWKKVVASCMYPIKSEMKISTDSERVMKARRFVIQILLNRNPKAIEINRLAEEYGVEREGRFASEPDLCIRCGRCVRACELNGTDAISMARTGFDRFVSPPYGETPASCTGCLACAEVCPTGKIVYRDTRGERRIWERVFELAECERCGARYATKEQLEYLKHAEQTKQDEQTEQTGQTGQIGRLGAAGSAGKGSQKNEKPCLCERCRKARYGELFGF